MSLDKTCKALALSRVLMKHLLYYLRVFPKHSFKKAYFLWLAIDCSVFQEKTKPEGKATLLDVQRHFRAPFEHFLPSFNQFISCLVLT